MIIKRKYGCLGEFPSYLVSSGTAVGHTPYSLLLIMNMCSKHVGDGAEVKEVKAAEERVVALRAVCCSTLTQLVLNDANAQLIVQVRLHTCVYACMSNVSPHALP